MPSLIKSRLPIGKTTFFKRGEQLFSKAIASYGVEFPTEQPDLLYARSIFCSEGPNKRRDGFLRSLLFDIYKTAINKFVDYEHDPEGKNSDGTNPSKYHIVGHIFGSYLADQATGEIIPDDECVRGSDGEIFPVGSKWRDSKLDVVVDWVLYKFEFPEIADEVEETPSSGDSGFGVSMEIYFTDCKYRVGDFDPAEKFDFDANKVGATEAKGGTALASILKDLWKRRTPYNGKTVFRILGGEAFFSGMAVTANRANPRSWNLATASDTVDGYIETNKEKAKLVELIKSVASKNANFSMAECKLDDGGQPTCDCIEDAIAAESDTLRRNIEILMKALQKKTTDGKEIPDLNLEHYSFVPKAQDLSLNTTPQIRNKFKKVKLSTKGTGSYDIIKEIGRFSWYPVWASAGKSIDDIFASAYVRQAIISASPDLVPCGQNELEAIHLNSEEDKKDVNDRIRETKDETEEGRGGGENLGNDETGGAVESGPLPTAPNAKAPYQPTPYLQYPASHEDRKLPNPAKACEAPSLGQTGSPDPEFAWLANYNLNRIDFDVINQVFGMNGLLAEEWLFLAYNDLFRYDILSPEFLAKYKEFITLHVVKTLLSLKMEAFESMKKIDVALYNPYMEIILHKAAEKNDMRFELEEDLEPNDEPLDEDEIEKMIDEFEEGEYSDAKIQKRKDVNPKSGEKKYGKVKFADPVNKKYPINSPEKIRAAWNYSHQVRNAAKYSSSEIKLIRSRIASAWKSKIDPAGPPSLKKKGKK